MVRDCPERFVRLEMPEGEKGWMEWYADVQQRYGLPHDVTVTRPDRFLLQNHYRGDDGTDWFLLANASFGSPQETDLVFPGPVCEGRQALLYNPDDGRRYTLALSGDTLHLRLGPSETVLIAFQDRPVKAPAWQPAPLPSGEAMPLSASWQVTLVNPQVDTVIRIEATPDGGGRLPDLKDTQPAFMGTATYRTTVSIPETELPRWLHLGHVCDIAEIRINGQPAGLRWWGDPVFDVSALLKPGDNELEIKVTTLMCNYMRTLTENTAARRFTLRRNHEPVSAGLLGPVILY